MSNCAAKDTYKIVGIHLSLLKGISLKEDHFLDSSVTTIPNYIGKIGQL